MGDGDAQSSNDALSNVLGVDLGLDDVFSALVDSNIPINDFITALEGVTNTTSADEALGSTITLSEYFTALADASSANGDTAAATALRSLSANVSGLTDGIVVSDFLTVQNTDGDVADGDVSTLELVSGGAQLYGSKNVASTPSPVTFDIVGLGEVQANLLIVEPPQLVCGPEGTTFKSAAVRVKLDVAFNEALSSEVDVGLASVAIMPTDLSMYLEVGEVDGEITQVDYAAQTAEVEVSPGTVNLFIGEIDDAVFYNTQTALSALDVTPSVVAGLEATVLGATTSASITAEAVGDTVSFGSGTLSFQAPFPQTDELATPVSSVGEVVGSVSNNLDLAVELGGQSLSPLLEPALNLATGAVNDLVTGDVLAPVLLEAVDPLLASLGLGIGEAVVTVQGISNGCDDFGDCPVSGTAPDGVGTNAYGEASHGLSSTLFLGNIAADGEAQNSASADASGDDTDGIDDEDSVTVTALVRGSDTTFTLTVAEPATATGYLRAWIDWNGNGTFDDGEEISDDLQDTDGDGTIEITVAVPEDIALASTFARFRYSGAAGLGATGPALDGEVEDYKFDIITPEGSISGTLYEDLNGSSLRDPEEPALPAGITVTLFDDKGTPEDTSDDIQVQQVETAADGTYLFIAVNALDSYRIEVDEADADIPATLVLSTDNPLSGVVVENGIDTGNQNFGFAPPPPLADLSLAKVALGALDGLEISEASAGTVVDFVLSVTNDGPDAAGEVIVMDLLPDGYEYVSDTASAQGGTYDPDTGVWVVGEVAQGETEAMTIRVTMRSTGEHTNRAEITASALADPDSDAGTGALVDDLGDGLPDDDEASATVSYVGTGATLTGFVFIDNGADATAYDALQSGTETRTVHAVVEIFDGSGTLLDTPDVAADGSWSLVLPDGYAQAVTVSVQPAQGYYTVSEAASDLPLIANSDPRDGVFSFTPQAGVSYTGLNVGLIAQARLNQDQQAAIGAGQVVELRHEYVAYAQGSVRFLLDAQNSTSENAFSAGIFQDADCNGEADGVMPDLLPVAADRLICLVVRVSASSALAQSASYSFDLVSETTYGATSVVETDRNTDILTVERSDGNLKLAKTVRNTTAGTAEGISNGASAGDVLEYRIYLENQGVLPAEDIIIYDRTPPYTALSDAVPSPVNVGDGVTCHTALDGMGVAGYAGALQWDCTGSYSAGLQGSVSFQVMVAP